MTTVAKTPVTDAFVDWNLNASNSPDLIAFIKSEIDKENFLPLTGEKEQGLYIEEKDGVFVGFREGNEFENRRTITVEHEDGYTVTGTWAYSHNVKSVVDNAMEVTFHDKTPSSFAVSKEKAEDIVSVVNEDPHNTGVSYWYYYNQKNNSWTNFVGDREDYDGYVNCDVELVPDDIATWVPSRKQ